MKRIVCLAALLGLLGVAGALADGWRADNWVHSELHGDVRLASYAGDYDGYVDVDGMGGITAADPYWLEVISKSASVWSEPRTNSKKVASAGHGETLLCRVAADDTPLMRDGFYAVEYKGRDGWVNADYVVRNTLEIVLMESNVPAYIAPDPSAKKVGSLAKLTRYRVIGIYDDFYIISLRGAAAAYIPMSARHYDTEYEAVHRQSLVHRGRANVETAVRTGPGDGYAQVKTLRAGESFNCIDLVDGWYLIDDADTGTDGGSYVYVDAGDTTVNFAW